MKNKKNTARLHLPDFYSQPVGATPPSTPVGTCAGGTAALATSQPSEAKGAATDEQ